MTRNRSEDFSHRLMDRQDSLYFRSFHLDRRGGRLMKAGEPIPLRPKTWAVLEYLAERPGVLVTKDELLDAVWPDVAVTPDTLTKSIGELRTALGEDSSQPRCIETVHGRGFRFLAETAAKPSVESASSPETGRRSTAWKESWQWPTGARASSFLIPDTTPI